MTLISTGLAFFDRGRISLPTEIAKIMNAIYHTLPQKDRGNEYGLYLKGEWDPSSCTVDVAPNEYYIPRQTVTSAFIKFDEAPPDPSWNVVIHRHPSGCRSFSGEDMTSINEEFLASMLYIPEWDFPDALINVPIAPGVKLRIKAEVKLDGDFYAEYSALRQQVSQAVSARAYSRPAAKGGQAEFAGFERFMGEGRGTGLRVGEQRQLGGGGSVELVGEAEAPKGQSFLDSERTGGNSPRGLRPLLPRGGSRRVQRGAMRMSQEEIDAVTEEFLDGGGAGPLKLHSA